MKQPIFGQGHCNKFKDSRFMGKTKYNVAYCLICNLLYCGIWFILYKTSVVVLSLEVIIIMLGWGKENIELWGMYDGGTWLRVSATLIEDNRIEVQQAVLDDPTGPS